MMRNKNTVIRISILGILGLLVLYLIYFLVISHKFVQVSTPDEYTPYQLVSLSGGKVLAEGSGGGIEHVPRGAYLVKTPEAIQTVDAGFFPYTKATVQTNTKAQKTLNILLYKNVSMITPITGGYVYKNNDTQAVEFINDDGIVNISENLGIKSADIADSGVTYNTIVSIAKTNDGVLLATNQKLFLMRSISDIQTLPLGLGSGQINIYRVSYSPANNTAFFLTAGTNSVYKYKLDQDAGAFEVYKSDLLINQVAASGSTVAVYYDNIPSDQADVISKYQKKVQIAPVFINAISGKVQENNFDKDTIITNLSISENGRYVAHRTKYKNVTIIEDTQNNTKTTLPASTIGTGQWIDNVFYMSSYGSVWTFNPAKDTQFQLYAATKNIIREFNISGSDLTVTTTDNSVLSTSVDKTIDTADLKLSQPRDYTIEFYVGTTDLLIDVFCPPAGNCTYNENYAPTINSLSSIVGLPLTITQKTPDSADYIYQL